MQFFFKFPISSQNLAFFNHIQPHARELGEGAWERCAAVGCHYQTQFRLLMRALRHTGLGAAEGGPMQAWCIVCWAGEGGGPFFFFEGFLFYAHPSIGSFRHPAIGAYYRLKRVSLYDGRPTTRAKTLYVR